MRRRSFLKLIGLATVWASSLGASAGAVAASTRSPTRTAPALNAAGLRYRVDGGRVFVSSDNGKSWTLHTYLGPGYTIQRVATDRGAVRLTVGFVGRTFGLVLASNQRSWLTV